MITRLDALALASARSRSNGSSIVGQSGRSARCRAMRAAMSASNGGAVATNVTSPSKRRPISTARSLLPLRAPPTSSVNTRWNGLVVDAALGGDTGAVRVLDLAHLGHRVGDRDELVARVATRHDDAHVR